MWNSLDLVFIFILFNASLADGVTNEIIKNEGKARNCTIDVDTRKFFNTLKYIEEKYKNDIIAFEKAIVPEKINEEMKNTLLNSRGLSDQAIEENLGRLDLIPAGLDLGGYCLLRMHESMLFFHRMKLRNSTIFTIKSIQNDFKNLVLRTKLLLNDLHLEGTYERLMQDKIPSNLFYSPTFGKVEILLKDVEYKMEARYRMISDRLMIELVISAIRLTEAVMVTKDATGLKKSEKTVHLDFNQIEDFLERIKSDVDSWIKDCFNDKLINFIISDQSSKENFLAYQRERTNAVSNYMHYLLGIVSDRMTQYHLEAIALPDFSIYSVNGMIFRLRNGAIRGLDTLYQRSVASSYIGTPRATLGHLCTEVSFSNLQVSYTYEAIEEHVFPALIGDLILSAKDLTALFSARVKMDPNSVNFVFQSIRKLGPEALTIQGPINKAIGNFRHIIQNHVLALMTYSLNYHVRNLKTLTECEPNVIPYHKHNMHVHGIKSLKRPLKHKTYQMKKKYRHNSRYETEKSYFEDILDYFDYSDSSSSSDYYSSGEEKPTKRKTSIPPTTTKKTRTTTTMMKTRSATATTPTTTRTTTTRTTTTTTRTTTTPTTRTRTTSTPTTTTSTTTTTRSTTTPTNTKTTTTPTTRTTTTTPVTTTISITTRKNYDDDNLINGSSNKITTVITSSGESISIIARGIFLRKLGRQHSHKLNKYKKTNAKNKTNNIRRQLRRRFRH